MITTRTHSPTTTSVSPQLLCIIVQPMKLAARAALKSRSEMYISSAINSRAAALTGENILLFPRVAARIGNRHRGIPIAVRRSAMRSHSGPKSAGRRDGNLSGRRFVRHKLAQTNDRAHSLETKCATTATQQLKLIC